MIKLNRTSEYGLIALRHIHRKGVLDPGGVTSAREISDTYGFPFEITAKTLQRLKDRGLIHSAQGSRGGYTLQRRLEEVTLGEFIDLMEGPQSLVQCAASGHASGSEATSCEYSSRCEIQSLMSDLNRRVNGFLSGIFLSELSSPSTSQPAVTSAASATRQDIA